MSNTILYELQVAAALLGDARETILDGVGTWGENIFEDKRAQFMFRHVASGNAVNVMDFASIPNAPDGLVSWLSWCLEAEAQRTVNQTPDIQIRTVLDILGQRAEKRLFEKAVKEEAPREAIEALLAEIPTTQPPRS